MGVERTDGILPSVSSKRHPDRLVVHKHFRSHDSIDGSVHRTGKLLQQLFHVHSITESSHGKHELPHAQYGVIWREDGADRFERGAARVETLWKISLVPWRFRARQVEAVISREIRIYFIFKRIAGNTGEGRFLPGLLIDHSHAQRQR